MARPLRVELGAAALQVHQHQEKPMAMRALKASYTIAELATLLGRTRHQMRGLLVSNGVELTRSGRAIYVLLIHMEQAWPELCRALREQGRGVGYRLQSPRRSGISP